MTLPMSADHLLAENVRALLAADPRSQSDLAQWCRHSSVWVSQFLTGKRKWKVEDLDRVADFFNLSTFQLFQPGIANSTTERRIVQRRQGEERRRTQSERELLKTKAELARVGMPGHRDRSAHLVAVSSPDSRYEELQRAARTLITALATVIPEAIPATKAQTAPGLRTGTDARRASSRHAARHVGTKEKKVKAR